MKLKANSNQKTSMAKLESVTRQWHLVDAKGQVLGRLATQIATYLMGKHKPDYSPHVDMGDYVVVINASQVRVTGKKETDKIYYRHSGYLGGLKQETLGDLRERQPEKIIQKAVFNMLPKNKLRSKRMNRLKVYPGNQHKHASQLKSETKNKE